MLGIISSKKLNAYGHKFRTEEIANTSQMQETEALFNQIKNKQSYELFNARLPPMLVQMLRVFACI